jgi:hypothetical protein
LASNRPKRKAEAPEDALDFDHEQLQKVQAGASGSLLVQVAAAQNLPKHLSSSDQSPQFTFATVSLETAHDRAASGKAGTLLAAGGRARLDQAFKAEKEQGEAGRQGLLSSHVVSGARSGCWSPAR